MRVSGQKILKTCTFAIFFTLFKFNYVPCDRRMIKSQETTGAVTPVLYGRGSYQFSLVCKTTRTSAGESDEMRLIQEIEI